MLEVDVVEQTVVEVNVRKAAQPLLPSTLLQIGEVALQHTAAGRAGIVGEHRRAALCKRRWRGTETQHHRERSEEHHYSRFASGHSQPRMKARCTIVVPVGSLGCHPDKWQDRL